VRRCLGIDIGLISVKAVLLEDGHQRWARALDHEGNIPAALRELLAEAPVPVGAAPPHTVVVGGAGRHQLRVEKAIPPQAIEAALAAIGERPAAVVSLGGESIVVYAMAPDGRVRGTIAGDKCAAGTGEFFRQQLARMGLGLDVLERIPDDTKPHPLSSRCSVFMKSDCTHKLNKREATKEEIVVSLAAVMASKVVEFLTRARMQSGRIVLVGGVAQNRFLRRHLASALPDAELVLPPQAACFEAFGAAHLAARHGTPLPASDELLDAATVSFDRYPPLAEAASLVSYVEATRGTIRPGREYVLGIDGGSTTTKAVLVDAETREICASCYGRTHGDPVAALRRVLEELQRQVRAQADGAHRDVRITLAATTGSSREVLGVFVETAGVYNEIVAHSVGTTHFRPGIDTLFEIGGQDAKYVYLKNGVPIDYAMNEACSAGTGSFLEETALGDLSIGRAEEIGPVALESRGPLRFGEHCSAFINSDIRTAIQEGASKPDIVGGIVFSIVSNYLNRVVGNRNIGGNIVLQGGVAKNPAVPAAFAAVLGKPIVVPPDPELLGAFGVALLALEKHAQGALDKGSFDLGELSARPIAHGKGFVCKSCENRCPIQTLQVGGRSDGRGSFASGPADAAPLQQRRYHFGGRCNRYGILRNRRKIEIDEVDNFVDLRSRMLFVDFAADPRAFQPRSDKVVGVPRVFSVHNLWPLYSHFFHELGVRTVLSLHSLREGVQRAEAAYCLPGELAHGMTEELLRAGVDHLFLPHLLDMESYERDVHATLCPITQGLPYFVRSAFDLADDRILRPVLSFRDGYETGSAPFVAVAERLGFSAAEGQRAFRVGIGHQLAFVARCREIGTEVLSRSRAGDDSVLIALFGRPYNAFAAEANMGVPRKFQTRGCRVLPFDFFPISDEEISENMYWYYGQQNLKAARLLREHPGIYLCYVSNFGCAPDSFLLHFVRWFMGQKPFLVLEMDSHTADAGVDTRIEAFLDIIAGYRKQAAAIRERVRPRRYSIALEGTETAVVDAASGARLPIRDRRVRLVWPSMGELSTSAMAAISAHQGIRSEHLPAADLRTVQLARAVASGKECIPTLLVLGQLLKLLAERPPAPDEVLAVIVPKTTGPCRTGQYGPFYERTFADLGIDNVAILYLSSDNGYKELGADFSRLAWFGLVLGDHFKDMELALGLVARDPAAALAVHRDVWRRVLEILGSDITSLYPYLEREGVPRLAAIERRRTLEELRRVIVVGEIYVRRDDFSTAELVSHLTANSIYPKITGITEWVDYCDYSAALRLRRRLAHLPWWRRPFAPEAREWLGLATQMTFQRAIEARLRQILEPCRLLPEFPHDMRAIMGDVDRFTDVDFETEATVSSLVSTRAVREGYDGIVAIAPFACLPGRLIKALVEPYARRRAIPFLAVESDGQAFPPSLVSRLEIFMLNVQRRGGDGAAFQTLAAPPAAAGPCRTDQKVLPRSVKLARWLGSDSAVAERAPRRSPDAPHDVPWQDPPGDGDARRPQL
jgi:predicted CoA-substrate-specific enzyme activase